MDYLILFLISGWYNQQGRILMLLPLNLFLLWKMFRSRYWQWYAAFFVLLNGYTVYWLWAELIPQYRYWNN